MVLTKRAERMRQNLNSHPVLPNVWCGVSCENQKYAEQRIPLLLATRAAVKFVSAEPCSVKLISLNR
jgi:protein gp37